MLIVPKDGGLEVEAHVSNRDIGFVHVGQDAEMKIATFNFTRYGLIKGIVTSLSQDAVVADQRQDDSKQTLGDIQKQSAAEPSYVAYVRLAKTWIETETGRSSLGPGMMVTAEIHTGRPRIIDYLLSPLRSEIVESLHER